VAISAGADYALALDQSGDVYAWGNGQQDQLGRRLVDRRRHESLLPNRMALPKKKITHIFAGSNHAFAIDKNKNVWAWGLNNFAQTGVASGAGEDGGTVTAPTKVAWFKNTPMKVIDGGTHHSIAVAEDGRCFVWGRMDSHQMGLAFSSLPLDDPKVIALDEREKPRILLQPRSIPDLLFSYAAAGSDHNVAITKDGRAYSWGFSGTFQCGQGDEEEIRVATLIDNTALRNQMMVWAGAGGQYSVFASTVHPRTE
jgi:regulator of chromosome condensation